MKYLMIIFVSLFIVVPAVSSEAQRTRATQFDHYHVVLDALLYKHVQGGRVNYERMIVQGTELDSYLRQVGGLTKGDYDGFTRDQKLALLLNTYNASVLKFILRNEPENSIRDVSVKWDEVRFPFLRKEYTLTRLRDEFLRKDFEEPRIHCAMSYASLGGPSLMSEAFIPDLLDEQLSAAAKLFVRDSLANRLDRENSILYVSKVFEWYGEDFIPKYGKSVLPSRGETKGEMKGEMTPLHRAIVGFFIENLSETDTAYLKTHPVEVRFWDFDWQLDSAFEK